MNIKTFKKGDIITRTEPIKEKAYTSMFSMGFSGSTDDNYTLVGKKIKLIGIANGLIYYHHAEEKGDAKEVRNPSSIVYDKYKDGWEKWIDPNTL